MRVEDIIDEDDDLVAAIWLFVVMREHETRQGDLVQLLVPLLETTASNVDYPAVRVLEEAGLLVVEQDSKITVTVIVHGPDADLMTTWATLKADLPVGPDSPSWPNYVRDFSSAVCKKASDERRT